MGVVWGKGCSSLKPAKGEDGKPVALASFRFKSQNPAFNEAVKEQKKRRRESAREANLHRCSSNPYGDGIDTEKKGGRKPAHSGGNRQIRRQIVSSAIGRRKGKNDHHSIKRVTWNSPKKEEEKNRDRGRKGRKKHILLWLISAQKKKKAWKKIGKEISKKRSERLQWGSLEEREGPIAYPKYHEHAANPARTPIHQKYDHNKETRRNELKVEKVIVRGRYGVSTRTQKKHRPDECRVKNQKGINRERSWRPKKRKCRLEARLATLITEGSREKRPTGSGGRISEGTMLDAK